MLKQEVQRREEEFKAISPVTSQVSVAILMQEATELTTRSFGAVLVAPVLRTVVVPLDTAEIVQSPAPMFITVITVPTGCATEALVGILKALAEALDMVTST